MWSSATEQAVHKALLCHGVKTDLRALRLRCGVVQVAALSADEFGRLQHEYVVAFAEHLLLRAAPLHTTTADDDRLVRTASTWHTHCTLGGANRFETVASLWDNMPSDSSIHSLGSQRQACNSAHHLYAKDNAPSRPCASQEQLLSCGCQHRRGPPDCCPGHRSATVPPSMLDVLHVSAGSVLQTQLVAELGRMRGALLLAFPDQGRALREHGMPPKDIGAAAGFSAAGDPFGAGGPLDNARHQEWVQVGFSIAASVGVLLLCSHGAAQLAQWSALHLPITLLRGLAHHLDTRERRLWTLSSC